MFEDPIYSALCSSITLQSNKKGFFQQFADNVTNLVDDKWLDNFGKLKTNKDRIMRCLNDKRIKDYVSQTLENVQEIYRAKSAVISQQRRQEAENLYRNGKVERSLLMYTQSIIRAISSSDQDSNLVLALWGRSTIFYEMKKFKFCLDDIKLCLKENLSDTLKFDAYWRMAECYLNLNQTDLARISLNVLQRMTVNNKINTWNDKINSKLNEISENKECVKHLDNPLMNVINKFGDLNDGPHPKLVGASKKLKINYNEEMGRHFVANERINTGDTLIIEDSYVCCLESEKFGSHCQFCLKRLETAIPCTDCSAVAFCSLDCRIIALKTFHKYECHYLDLLVGSGMSILCFAALRIVTQQNVKYFAEAFAKNEKNDHPYSRIYNMVNHGDKRTAIDFLRRTLMALFLLSVTRRSGYFNNSKDFNNTSYAIHHLLISDVILRNLEVLQFNAHEIYETVKCKTTDSFKSFNIGIGLYETAAYFNHDCYPAVSRHFIGKKLIIKATKSTFKNEIVGDNYGPIFTKHIITDRRKKLSSRYWFHCQCRACQENWPLLENLDDKAIKIKCLSCEQRILIGEEMDKKICEKCFLPIDITELLKKITKMKQLCFQILQTEILNNEQITILCSLFDSLNEIVQPPNKIFQLIQNKLIQTWISYCYIN